MPDLTPAEQRTARRLLVTGSRDWTDSRTLRDALRQAWVALGGINADVTLVHGDCPRGADRMAAREWATWGRPVEPHPADWIREGKAAGPIRNQQMVDLGADLCLAFPLGESRGTRHCMAAARRAGIPVKVVESRG